MACNSRRTYTERAHLLQHEKAIYTLCTRSATFRYGLLFEDGVGRSGEGKSKVRLPAFGGTRGGGGGGARCGPWDAFHFIEESQKKTVENSIPFNFMYVSVF